MGRWSLVALCLLLLVAPVSMREARAEEGFPPPPPPPLAGEMPPTGNMPMADEPPPTPEEVDEMPVETPVVVDEPVPAPSVEVIEAPAAPAAGPALEMRPMAADCRPACGQRRDACCWPVDCRGCRYGRTRVTLEGTFGILNDPEGLLGTPAFGFAQQFDWAELDYGGSFGGRVTVEHAFMPQTWIQLRGAYYGSWDDDVTRVGVLGFQPGNTFGAGIPGGRVGASADVQGTLDSEADLYGGELNYIEEFTCRGCSRWDFLMGFRWLQFNETARADFATPPIPLFAGPSSVVSDVENTFLGLQLGARFHYQPSDSLEFLMGFKALAGNLNRQVQINDQNIFAGGAHAASRETDEIVFGADIELGLRWRPVRCIAFTLGYNLLFLDNVTRANDAMDFSYSGSGAVQASDRTDQLLWHGVFAGVSFEF